MKKTLLPLAVLALSLSSCDTTPIDTINGTVEGEQTGTAYLVTYAKQKADTLAKGDIADGKFTLSGNVENLTPAYLILEGKRGGTPVFVENANFTATLNPANPMENKIEGSETQNLYNEFAEIQKEVRKQQNELYKAYREASEAKDEAKMQEIEAQFGECGKAAQAKTDALVSNNNDTYVAAYIVASEAGSLEVAQLEEKYAQLGENAKATEPGKQIAERIEKLKATAVGQVAPDFTLNTPEGKPLSMHSIKGKVKLIDFWASWCGPCRGENPNVVKVYKEFHPKGLEILSVSLDSDKEAWLKAIEDDQLTWNHVSDLKGWGSEAAQLYAVSGIPHLVVLDENNVIVAKNLRGEQLREQIASMLK